MPDITISNEQKIKLKNEMLNSVSLVELISQPSEEEGAQESATSIYFMEATEDND